ncbi:hypothetical protein K449DRAFT_466699 [Hypoxylon sp. EC38]|nr:hypothetical protein K449DRAFT_466699 [Hypoxylon sp. EC38]
MAQSEMINKGLAQVFTGLGILLGAGRISNDTHEQILALINADQGFTNTNATDNSGDAKETLNWFPRPGKDTPISVGSHELLGVGGDFANLSIADKPSRSPAQPVTQKPPAFKGPSAYASVKSNTESKIICPWWSTEGYSCRDHEKGRCTMYHEDIADGVKDPLICHFWADGGRCTKSETTCRFAHYPAQHRLVAPMPSKKKNKKLRTSTVGEDWSRRPTPAAEADDDGYWGTQIQPRNGTEW